MRHKHHWFYEHTIFGNERTSFAVRRCYPCGQWQKGNIVFKNVKACPVEPPPDLDVEARNA